MSEGGEPPRLDSVLAGRYRLQQRVGRGGMADVYRALDETLHRAVAVKLFRVDSAGPDEHRRIDAEMRTLAALRHPGLIRLYDAHTASDEPDSVPYLVMEYIDGITLRQRIAMGALSTQDTATLGAELAGALRYVHSAGVVHRDIKPANVLLDDGADGSRMTSAKLSDFDIATLVESTRHTAAGTTVNTANYLSPEQAVGGTVGPPSDIYSFGLVLIECLTGRLAYPGSGVEAAVARLHRPPDLPAHAGAAWTELLASMTALAPAARPDAERVTRTLTALAKSDHPASQNPRLTDEAALPGAAVNATAALTSGTAVLAATQTPPPARRRRYGLALGAAAAALVAAVNVALVLHDHPAHVTAGSGGPVTHEPRRGRRQAVPRPTPW